jgi:hypothetical protein
MKPSRCGSKATGNASSLPCSMLAVPTERRGTTKHYSGRGKKNFKSCDLVLAAFFCVVIRRAIQGNSAIVVGMREFMLLFQVSLRFAGILGGLFLVIVALHMMRP